MTQEILKLKRTLVWPSLLLAPVGVAALNWLALRNPRNAPMLWERFVSNGEVMWALLMMPLLVALVVSQVAGIEHTSGSWRVLLSRPRARWVTYLRKLGVLMLLFGVAHLLLVPLLALTGSLLPHDLQNDVPWGNMFRHAGLMWLASLGIVSVILALAVRFPSFLLPSGVGAAATVAGAISAGGEYAHYWPWVLAAYAVRGEEGVTLTWVLTYSGAVAALALLWGMWSLSRRDV